MLGIFGISDALALARTEGLDLMEISPNASPPVCKIDDFGKYKYELQKKAHEVKRKQKAIVTKEVKIRPTIADGDYAVKLRNILRFLQDGDRVRISLMFKGREITHKEVGFELMKRLEADLAPHAKIDSLPRMEGKQIIMLVSPKV